MLSLLCLRGAHAGNEAVAPGPLGLWGLSGRSLVLAGAGGSPGEQRWGNLPASLCAPQHLPQTSWGSPALSGSGGAQLIIGAGGAQLIIGVGGAVNYQDWRGSGNYWGWRGSVNYWGWRGLIHYRVGGAQLIISRSHCYSSGGGEGGSALRSGSISVLISMKRGGEEKCGFSFALKSSSHLPVPVVGAGCSGRGGGSRSWGSPAPVPRAEPTPSLPRETSPLCRGAEKPMKAQCPRLPGATEGPKAAEGPVKAPGLAASPGPGLPHRLSQNSTPASPAMLSTRAAFQILD